jgi:hypothetical protein
MVAAALLGMLAGAAACGAATQTDVKGAQPPPPGSSAPAAGDKSACGNHPGSSCAAVSAPKK